MDEPVAGRGHREKIPSAKLKEQTIKPEKVEDEKRVILPTYIAHNDPRFCLEQKELSKTLDHVKILPDGTKVEYYALGNQCVPSCWCSDDDGLLLTHGPQC